MNTATLALNAADAKEALLEISGLHLILPQKEIRALEAASDIDTDDAQPFSVGWIQYLQQRWPVYCLSSELSLLVMAPPERRACVLLDAGTGYVGILCDEVSIARQAQAQRHELPSVMRLPETPVLGLAVLDGGEIACITGGKQMAAHVARLVGM